jgi:MFS family permease
MTIGLGNFGPLNGALLLAAFVGFGLFVLAQARSTSPLIPFATFCDPALSASFLMSALVSTVLMATLVVGPFYLSGALELNAAVVGSVMSVGPLVAALTGVLAGRFVDRFGSHRVTIVGLMAIVFGSVVLSVLPPTLGVAGYIGPIIVVTAGYSFFQTANAAAATAEVGPAQRGVVSGMLHLSRNLGLITGASVIGTVFALATGTIDVGTATPDAVASGVRVSFAIAAVLMILALAVAIGSRAFTKRPWGALTAGVHLGKTALWKARFRTTAGAVAEPLGWQAVRRLLGRKRNVCFWDAIDGCGRSRSAAHPTLKTSQVPTS